MSLLKIIILAIVQGLAELLPVSSSAHVVVAEKLLGLDPSSPSMTLLLVMLHTGTMFAVIVYFWPQWRSAYFRDGSAFKKFAALVIVATAFTAVIGEALIKVIEKTLFRDVPHAEIEDLFSHLEFIAPALAAAGLLILIAGILERRNPSAIPAESKDPDMKQAGLIGAVQGLCLPFRGFSRSGATISTAMLLGVAKSRAEAFSFALAVVLTPPIVVRDAADSFKGGLWSGRPGLGRGSKSVRCRGRLPRRSAGIEMAEPVARGRPMVFVRHLLPGGCGGGDGATRSGILSTRSARAAP
jgi:undecaprenyl-diphosphatase